MLKERTDYRLKETEKIRDAVKRNNTFVKDYSMQNIVSVSWDLTPEMQDSHSVCLKIGDSKKYLHRDYISRLVHELVTEQDKYGWLPRKSVGEQLNISTLSVNRECLRDHVASVTMEGCSAIIDLEELLKAIRYA